MPCSTKHTDTNGTSIITQIGPQQWDACCVFDVRHAGWCMSCCSACMNGEGFSRGRQARSCYVHFSPEILVLF